MEKRSTCPPASAILITAARPASPPPTTIILGVDAINLLNHKGHEGPRRSACHRRNHFCNAEDQSIKMVAQRPIGLSISLILCVPSCPLWLILNAVLFYALFSRRRIFPMIPPLRTEECCHRYPSDKDQSERQHGTSPAHPLAGGFTDCNAPLGTEKIYAVREMPRRGDDPDQIKHPIPPVLKLDLHFVKRGIGMREQVCSGKTHGVGVPEDVNKGDAAGPALRGIHEISRPGIIADVGFAAEPDVEPVQSVIQKRNIDADRFKDRNERQPG